MRMRGKEAKHTAPYLREVFRQGRIRLPWHAKDHLERAKPDLVAVLDQFRLQRGQHELAQARLVVALEILDIEEGALKTNTRVLA